MKVMFIGAHPDDAEIYSFGALLSYAKHGADIVLVLATAGEAGVTVRSQHQPLAKTRMEEAEKAALMLPARLVQLGMPDGGLTPLRAALALRLIELMDAEAPHVILTHSPNDYHADHRALSAAVALAAGARCPIFYIDNMKGQHFRPTHYVNITPFQAQKMLALRQHHSQKPRRYVLAATALAEARAFEATGKSGLFMEGLRFDANPAFKSAERLLPHGTIPAPPVLHTRPNPIAENSPKTAPAT